MTKFLTDQQIDFYAKDGYLTSIQVIDIERVSYLKSRYESFKRKYGKEADPILRSKPHLVFPDLYDLAIDPCITNPVSSILGPNLLVWGTSFFSKNGSDPSFVSWHQDANYWGLEPHHVLTAWIALTPSKRENGCMRLVPGSHSIGSLVHRDTFNKNNLLTRGQEITVTVDESQVVDIELEPGEMSLHHVGLVHGSDPNTSPKDRIGFAIRYIATNVKQISGRTTATLARGVDEFSHFDLEPRPMREYDDSCRNFRNHALEKQQQILFAGVNQEPSSESHTLSNLS